MWVNLYEQGIFVRPSNARGTAEAVVLAGIHVEVIQRLLHATLAARRDRVALLMFRVEQAIHYFVTALLQGSLQHLNHMASWR